MNTDIRDVALGDLPALMEAESNGTLRIRSALPPLPPAHRITDRLDHWAREAPDRVFLAERDAGGEWCKVTYAEARDRVGRIAAALLTRDLGPERPLAILSGNDIEQALIGLAAMMVGIPFAPISPAYSLMSSDYEKLRVIIGELTPGMVFTANTGPFAKAIARTIPAELEIVATRGTLEDRKVTPFSALLEHGETPAVTTARDQVGPDTIAKILFTSGSTGLPKGVINTQRMLTTNQAMLNAWLTFALDEPPVLVDWLPWHHTFGGNHNFNFVLNNGGSLYIDAGKPVPAGIGETIRNLSEIAPTIYFNVPKGYEEMIVRMREDEALCKTFFSRLKLTFYAGAGLPPHVGKELAELSQRTIGQRVLMVTSLGSTETAPAALSCTKETARPGIVGVPLPGIELKLVPNAEKLELRIKGPTITPGYWRNAEQTAKAFDDEGYYCLGDALKFATPGDPNGGFIFDGRISEDFKLATGTWVSVGPLRARLIGAFAPLIRDAVIAGHDRDDVMAMLIPDLDACRARIGAGAANMAPEQVLAHLSIRDFFAEVLGVLAKDSTGSSNRVARVMLLAEPPSIDANEITDKGSINQRAVLTRRKALVEALYADLPTPEVILPKK